ncbi:MAG: ATP-dependent zinc protease [Reinekea sp.]|nr:ATP-dependent zinc protease [Reinekea sp.]MDX1472536.1 ATP-dependent zinc protease [Reinekea sp.]
MSDKILVGAIETCSLPELKIQDLDVRIDTGAKTSSLHVDHIKKFQRNGKPWVSFDIHPTVHNVEETISTESKLKDIRRIKSSNGQVEERYIITTQFQLGNDVWDIDISLTDRSDMSFLMLLGREGMGSRIIVDPSQTYLVSSEEAG